MTVDKLSRINDPEEQGIATGEVVIDSVSAPSNAQVGETVSVSMDLVCPEGGCDSKVATIVSEGTTYASKIVDGGETVRASITYSTSGSKQVNFSLNGSAISRTIDVSEPVGSLFISGVNAPQAVDVGETATFSMSIGCDGGNCNTSTATITSDGQTVTSQSVNGGDTVRGSISYPSPGSKTVTFSVARRGTSRTIDVVGPADLNVSCSGGPDTPLGPGESATYDATVTNDGGQTGSKDIYLRVGGNKVSSIRSVSLGPGESTTESMTLTYEEAKDFGLIGQTWDVDVVDDATQTTLDSCGTIEIAEPPNINFISCSLPTSVADGESFQPEVVVENIGEVTARNFDVQWTWDDTLIHSTASEDVPPGQKTITGSTVTYDTLLNAWGEDRTVPVRSEMQPPIDVGDTQEGVDCNSIYIEPMPGDPGGDPGDELTANVTGLNEVEDGVVEVDWSVFSSGTADIEATIEFRPPGSTIQIVAEPGTTTGTETIEINVDSTREVEICANVQESSWLTAPQEQVTIDLQLDGDTAPPGTLKAGCATVTVHPSGDPGGCDSNVDCPDGQSCVEGTCTSGGDQCQSGADCPSGEKCVDGECVPETGSGCTGNDDCGQGEICVNGSCVKEPTDGGNRRALLAAVGVGALTVAGAAALKEQRDG